MKRQPSVASHGDSQSKRQKGSCSKRLDSHTDKQEIQPRSDKEKTQIGQSNIPKDLDHFLGENTRIVAPEPKKKSDGLYTFPDASLLGLPRELRLQVLSYLLPDISTIPFREKSQNRPLETVRGKVQCNAYYKPLRNDRESCWPQILRVHSKIQHEGVEFMYRKKNFEISLDDERLAICNNRFSISEPTERCLDDEKLLHRRLSPIKLLPQRLSPIRSVNLKIQAICRLDRSYNIDNPNYGVHHRSPRYPGDDEYAFRRLKKSFNILVHHFQEAINHGSLCNIGVDIELPLYFALDPSNKQPSAWIQRIARPIGLLRGLDHAAIRIRHNTGKLLYSTESIDIEGSGQASKGKQALVELPLPESAISNPPNGVVAQAFNHFNQDDSNDDSDVLESFDFDSFLQPYDGAWPPFNISGKEYKPEAPLMEYLDGVASSVCGRFATADEWPIPELYERFLDSFASNVGAIHRDWWSLERRAWDACDDGKMDEFENVRDEVVLAWREHNRSFEVGCQELMAFGQQAKARGILTAWHRH